MPSNSKTSSREELARLLSANAVNARQHHHDLLWFASEVRENGPWDYKRAINSSYEQFGNYNYGYTGAALGISEQMLLQAAGAIQIFTDLKGYVVDATDGKIYNRIGQGSPFVGPPYGDDPNDQTQIIDGINDYLKCSGER